MVRKQLRYRVQWVGHDVDVDEYLPKDLNYTLIALRAFYNEYLTKPGPLKNLDYWLECALNDTWPEKRRNDNGA